MRFLFSAAIFLNAVLLFSVQPMVGKMLLPLFGGTSGVWLVSMVFFQAVLLLGYLYAHGVTKLFGVKSAALAHLAVLLIAAFTLPLSIPEGWAPRSPDPTLELLFILLRTVGPTFFALAAGAPLLQRWYSETSGRGAGDPYFLYAASNAGSMLSLLSYPFLIEPFLTLSQQRIVWSASFGLIFLLLAACAIQTRKAKVPSEEARVEIGAGITWKQRLLWIAAAAVPSSMMLGTTTVITKDLAPVPLLWILPLALYLATFILAFAQRQVLSASRLSILWALAACPMLAMTILDLNRPIYLMFPVHLGGFFLAAWMCHSRIAESRPSASHLTEFYFWIALGGVIGGAFTAIVAPLAFNDYVEYPLSIIAAVFLVKARAGRTRVAVPAAMTMAVTTVIVILGLHNMGFLNFVQRDVLYLTVAIAAALIAIRTPVIYGTTALGAFLAFFYFADFPKAVLYRGRSFYGVLEVTLREAGGKQFVALGHGNTLHGQQSVSEPLRPQAYYHDETPLGELYRTLNGRFQDVATLGLGAGSVAAFGRPGQNITFYEIDPLVEAVAFDPKLFTYLRDSQAEVRMVRGDGRLLIAKAPDASYDFILLDAFSSDSVPVHLLTREAIRLYFSKLKPGGVVCFNVSNRYLQLRRVLVGAAEDLGLKTLWKRDLTYGPPGKEASEIMLLARTSEDFGELRKVEGWQPVPATDRIRPWTDEYSNPFAAMNILYD